MKRLLPCALAACSLYLAACGSTRSAARPKDDGRIEINFVQVNDVYEIAPLSGGKEGGMARVATLKKRYLQQNPNTFLVMAGDFVSPSVYSSLQHEGKRVRGRQMIEAMNAAGTDFAVFGNHEFDINENELQERIDESRFDWISSNTLHQTQSGIAPFVRRGTEAIPKTKILTVRDADGTEARIGLIGITLPFNKADYVFYTDPIATARELYNSLKDSVDAVVAITHQSVEEDMRLAREVPGLAAILGGHEHDRRFEKVGRVYVTKAHANAKSAYVTRLKIRTRRGKIKADPQLVYLNETVALDSATNVVVNKWMGIAESNFSSLGFNARNVVLQKGEPLDGRESEVRVRPTNLTRLVVQSMQDAAPAADVVLMNSGSIRVDDIMTMPVTEYDIIRALPFGGGIREADMKGSLLIRTLDAGRSNAGNGGFLIYNENLVYHETTKTWLWKGAPLDASKTYRVAIAAFLLTGKEVNLDFLHPKNPEIIRIYEPEASPTASLSDIRLAMIRYLQKKG